MAARFTRLTAAAADFVAALVREVLRLAVFLGDDPLRFRPPDFFLAEDLRAPREALFFLLDFRADDFFADARFTEDFLALERAPDLRDFERLLPLFFRAPDFLDVAMKWLRM